MLPYRSANKIRIEDFQVRPEDRPDWVSGTTRLPRAGEEIYCAAGEGTVTALLGKTGDGSRLVQIGLASAPKHPFFAAASNVLLPPPVDEAPSRKRKSRVAATVAAEPAPWLGGSWDAEAIGQAAPSEADK
jgi:hypothetical protein